MWLTIAAQLVSGVLGFAGQYLPDWLKGKQEDAREEKMVRLQIELEKEKTRAAGDKAYADRETLEAVNGLQLEMSELNSTVQNQIAAREYGVKIVSMADQTLARGKEMKIAHGWLTVGWLLVLAIECFSASVQPCIAAVVFIFWGVTKALATPAWVWDVSDWMLLDAVIGFYLGGRLKKAKAAQDAS